MRSPGTEADRALFVSIYTFSLNFLIGIGIIIVTGAS